MNRQRKCILNLRMGFLLCVYHCALNSIMVKKKNHCLHINPLFGFGECKICYRLKCSSLGLVHRDHIFNLCNSKESWGRATLNTLLFLVHFCLFSHYISHVNHFFWLCKCDHSHHNRLLFVSIHNEFKCVLNEAKSLKEWDTI